MTRTSSFTRFKRSVTHGGRGRGCRSTVSLVGELSVVPEGEALWIGGV